MPRELFAVARRKLAALDAAESLEQLRHPSFRLHALRGERKGQWSIAVNDQYRIWFVWNARERNAYEVEVVDYH
jgi:proteic killer suppression protein